MKETLHPTYLKQLLIVAVTAMMIAGCSSDDEDKDRDREDSSDLITNVKPVERDFAEIKQSGVLRMITYYSSNTYFLNQGIEVGFEYELIKEFARENNLALEVVIVGDENPFELLNLGEGDVIAANYTITSERKKVATFTRPYNIVDQLVVYSADVGNPPQTIEQMAESGIPISVRRNSSYHYRLQNLIKEGYDIELDLIEENFETEASLVQVANGNFMATVADDNMFDAANRYMQGLLPGPVIAKSDTIAWAVRQNATDLESKMNQFLYKHFRFSDDRDNPRRSTFLNVLRKKYFEGSRQMANYYNPDWNYQSLGIISPYDEIVKSVSDSLGLDWLMVTAMIAQESSFNPESKSWAGAVGLMQVLPRFVETSYEELYDPVKNIQVGAQIIKEHLDHYAYMDSTNQWSFALATYNVGQGHMADARRLAIDRNRDPNEWEYVSDSLIRLMQRRYYQDARYGFARGIEPVKYVEEIMNRYRTYQAVMALAEQQQQSGFTNTLIPGFIRRQ